MASNLYLVIITFVMLATAGVTRAADCTQAATSEGLVTLSERQLACAQLKEGESPEDLGRQYVQCVHGKLYTMPCPPGLRWDTSINNCNFPETANCALPEPSASQPPNQETTTTRRPARRSQPPSQDTTTTRRPARRSQPSPRGTATTRRPARRSQPPSRETATTRRPARRNQPSSRETATTRRPARTSPTTTADEDYYDDYDDVTETTRPTPTTTTTTTTTFKATRRRRTRQPTRRTATTTTPVATIRSSTTARGRTWRTEKRVETTKEASLDSTSTKKTTDTAAGSRDCPAVDTSEGSRTLLHGQMACAPLGTDEDESNIGRKFVVCSSRNVYTQSCQAGLRFDTATGLCNWPDVSTCQFKDGVPTDKSGPVQSTSGASTATRQPTQPANTRRPSSPGRCSSDNCQLPDCFCFGSSPADVASADLPMFIMLTFDDAVTSTLYSNYFRALFVDNDYKLANPNGCRTKSTFYVSHENTDYTLVKAIWDAGNEIGSHTIHHQLPQGDKDEDYTGMVAEIQGLKDEMSKATGNKTLVDSVIGFRSPYLRVAGDVQFDVLKDFGFLYDTSILNINILQGKTPHWPYTLDYLVGECINPPCPTKSYPGLWEVPLNGWIGDDKQGCSMVDACVVGSNSREASEEQWYNFYKRNFEDYFYPVKVPMPIFTHGFLFANYPNSYSALATWLQDLLQSHDDVWLVTPAQVIDWMKHPLTNQQMMAQKWGC